MDPEPEKLRQEVEKLRHQNNALNLAHSAQMADLEVQARQSRAVAEEALRVQEDLRDQRETQAERKQAMFALSRALGDAEKRFADDPLRLFQRVAMIRHRWEGLGFAEQDLTEVVDKTYFAEASDRIRDASAKLKDTSPDAVEAAEEYNRLRLELSGHEESVAAARRLERELEEIQAAPAKAVARRDALAPLERDLQRWSLDFPGLLHVFCWLGSTVSLGLGFFGVLAWIVAGPTTLAIAGAAIFAMGRGKKFLAKPGNPQRLQDLQGRLEALALPEKDLAKGGTFCHAHVKVCLKLAQAEAGKPLDPEATRRVEAELAGNRKALQSGLEGRKVLEEHLRGLVAVHPALGEWDEAAREFQALPVPAGPSATGSGRRVVLENAGDHKVQLIQALREVLPNLSLLEAKALVDGAPRSIDCQTRKDAERLERLLNDAGGKARIEG